MKPLNRQQKIYLALVIALLVLVGLGYFIFWPWWQGIEDIKNTISSTKNEIEELQRKQATIKRLLDDETKLDDELKILEAALIPEDNALDFIVRTEEIANYNNVAQEITLTPAPDEEETKKKITPKKDEDAVEDPLAEVPSIEGLIILEGSFQDILKYAANFERIIPYAEITELTIDKIVVSDIKSNVSRNEDISGTPKAFLKIRIFTRKYES